MTSILFSHHLIFWHPKGDFELFASPLNAAVPNGRFSSKWPHVEWRFGSIGSYPSVLDHLPVNSVPFRQNQLLFCCFLVFLAFVVGWAFEIQRLLLTESESVHCALSSRCCASTLLLQRLTLQMSWPGCLSWNCASGFVARRLTGWLCCCPAILPCCKMVQVCYCCSSSWLKKITAMFFQMKPPICHSGHQETVTV